MEFKVLILCVGLLAVATPPSSICKCEPGKKDSVSTYDLKFSKDGEKYDEKLKVDTEKETETFHVPKTSSGEEEADIVYDFKKNKTMLRVLSSKSCYLYNSTENIPKPDELVVLLSMDSTGALLPRNPTEVKLKVLGPVHDRSDLTDEMADLCSKLTIYRVAKGTPVYKTLPKREKRHSLSCSLKCKKLCLRVCDGIACFLACRKRCPHNHCR